MNLTWLIYSFLYCVLLRLLSESESRNITIHILYKKQTSVFYSLQLPTQGPAQSGHSENTCWLMCVCRNFGAHLIILVKYILRSQIIMSKDMNYAFFKRLLEQIVKMQLLSTKIAPICTLASSVGECLAYCV